MSSEKHQRPVQFTPKTLSAAEYSDLVFCVPIYQRLFAWGKKQIRKLMNDLYESFPSGNPYYLGILTVAPHDLKFRSPPPKRANSRNRGSLRLLCRESDMRVLNR